MRRRKLWGVGVGVGVVVGGGRVAVVSGTNEIDLLIYYTTDSTVRRFDEGSLDACLERGRGPPSDTWHGLNWDAQARLEREEKNGIYKGEKIKRREEGKGKTYQY